ncbi:MAG: CheR family methyltransferase [Thermodesulfobacteriota bacterium]
MDDNDFHKLLDFRGMCWSGYRRVRKGVKKRIRRHMRELGCGHVDDYIECLKADPKANEKSQTLMTVPISRFFRDRQLWTDLAARYVPELVSLYPEGIRVWSAGCAGGEEAYSFRMLWYRLEKELGPPPVLDILATDRNQECIERARKGLFQLSSLREIRDDSRSIFFTEHRKGKLFQISTDLISSISFKQQDLLQKPPDGVFQLIFLRNNLLTYHRSHSIRPVFNQIVNCLTPGGLLIIGAHEKLPPETKHLKPYGPMVLKKVINHE